MFYVAYSLTALYFIALLHSGHSKFGCVCQEYQGNCSDSEVCFQGRCHCLPSHRVVKDRCIKSPDGKGYVSDQCISRMDCLGILDCDEDEGRCVCPPLYVKKSHGSCVEYASADLQVWAILLGIIPPIVIIVLFTKFCNQQKRRAQLPVNASEATNAGPPTYTTVADGLPKYEDVCSNSAPIFSISPLTTANESEEEKPPPYSGVEMHSSGREVPHS